ncbi:RebB family R body protein [Alteromonas sp. a30]|uniref:RebB family R body protein n=1 Tax=Alteromonas sp. a30 TaxID=2730917 RepID=UPI00228046F2|nr:RebB family R body protein [Alteromonas sp. a30]MCY7295019.1 RebB family R body protein [Alteromonas sp. a30]
MTGSTVNDVITDSVTQSSTLLTSIAAPHGQALLDMASAETMGMAMYNAISAQQNAQLTTNASVTATCAKMLAVGPAVQLPPVEKPDVPPPPFMPLSGGDASGGDGGSSKADAEQLIAMANTLIDSAAKDIGSQSSSDADVQKNLKALIAKLQSLESKGGSSSEEGDKSVPSSGTTPTT